LFSCLGSMVDIWFIVKWRWNAVNVYLCYMLKERVT
jgi:hypothetical protein